MLPFILVLPAKVKTLQSKITESSIVSVITAEGERKLLFRNFNKK